MASQALGTLEKGMGSDDQDLAAFPYLQLPQILESVDSVHLLLGSVIDQDLLVMDAFLDARDEQHTTVGGEFVEIFIAKDLAVESQGKGIEIQTSRHPDQFSGIVIQHVAWIFLRMKM